MKYNAKEAIMSVFKRYPNRPLTSMEFYEQARERDVFVPPAFNTHLSQLHKSGKLEKPARSTYLYRVAPLEGQLNLFNI